MVRRRRGQAGAPRCALIEMAAAYF